MKRHVNIFEKLLLVLIIAYFFIPLAVSVFFENWKTPLPHTLWLRNATLQRVVSPPEPLSWSKLWSGAFQQNLADRFNTGFAGREVLIRATCETWFRLFNKTPLNIPIVLGKDNFIFNENYLVDYCLTRTTSSQLQPFLGDLRKLQDNCSSLGIGFVLVLTPGKASIMAEYLPPTWLERYDSRPRTYDLIVPLIKHYGIHLVDGHVLTQKAKKEAITPIFPKGGIHWDPYGSWMAGNAILSTLRDQGKRVAPIEYIKLRIAEKPEGEECDVLSLMNLAIPWSYPSTELTVKSRRQEECSRLKFTIIGGSFMTKISKQLSTSEPLSRIDHYFYYTKGAAHYVGGQEVSVVSGGRPLDFKDIFSSDCLLLEANEDVLGVSGPLHLQDFVRDALKFLADRRLAAR